MSGYAEYREVNLPWLKTVPAHWEIRRNKNIFTEQKEIVGERSADYTLLSLTLNGIIPRDMDGGGKFPESFDKYKIVKSGDMAFCLFDIDETPRTVGLSGYNGMLTGAYTIMRVSNINARFIYYYYLALDNGKMLRPLYTGLRKTININTFQSTKVPVPPREEQDQIVRFLDWKVSSINKLTGIRKKQVAEYEVLRQRIILSSVTHGLNKAAPVKMCEEQWIAEMPTHWSLLPIKRLFKIFSGATPQSGNSEYWNGDIVWITPADFKTKDHYIYQGSKNLTDSGFSACSTSMIPPGSIVFSKRAPVGTVAINKVDLCTNQGCLSCVPVEGVSSEFFYYTMSVCTEEFERRAAGTTFKEISLTAFGSFLMPVPPIDEQLEIVNYLEKTCRDIDLAIQNIQSQIEALNELKSRIIADTVIGKIDVRSIEIPEYEFVDEDTDTENEDDSEEETEEQED